MHSLSSTRSRTLLKSASPHRTNKKPTIIWSHVEILFFTRMLEFHSMASTYCFISPVQTQGSLIARSDATEASCTLVSLIRVITTFGGDSCAPCLIFAKRSNWLRNICYALVMLLSQNTQIQISLSYSFSWRYEHEFSSFQDTGDSTPGTQV
jgi:hypothetical protein